MTDAPCLQRRDAAFVALTALSFVDRRAQVYPNRLARAAAFVRRGVKRGDGLSLLARNTRDLMADRHRAIGAAAVAAKADAKRGETPGAFIALQAGARASAAEMRQFCKVHLAGFKVSKHFPFETLPNTAAGKIENDKLRERAKAI